MSCKACRVLAAYVQCLKHNEFSVNLRESSVRVRTDSGRNVKVKVQLVSAVKASKCCKLCIMQRGMNGMIKCHLWFFLCSLCSCLSISSRRWSNTLRPKFMHWQWAASVPPACCSRQAYHPPVSCGLWALQAPRHMLLHKAETKPHACKRQSS